MKYESDILKRLINTYGVVGNPRYISEIIKEFIVRGKECYPNLFTYQSDWLAHIDEFGLTPEYTVSYTGQHIYAPNTKEKPVKRAILEGCTLVNLVTTDTSNGYTLTNDGTSLKGKDLDLIDGFDDKYYTIILELSDVNIVNPNASWVVYITTRSLDDKGADNTTIKSYIKNGKVSLLYRPIRKRKTIKSFSITLHTDSGIGSSITISNVVVLDGDYTNVDIPYFIGMQSVKMPVLTTIGKNVVNPIEDLFVYRSGFTKPQVLFENGGFNFISEFNGSICGFRLPVKLLKDEMYYVKCDYENMTTIRLYGSNVLSDEIDTTWETIVIDQNGGRFSFNKQFDYYYVAFYPNQNSRMKIKNLQIEQGSTATPYEPYKTNILTVNDDVELRGIGNVQDTLDCLTGELTQRIGEFVLDGSEEWSINNSNNEGFFSCSTTTYVGVPNGKVISDKLPSVTSTKTEGVMLGVTTGKLLVSFNRDKTGVTSLAKFKEKLAQLQLKVCYEIENVDKTVGLTIHDKDQQKVEQLTSFDGGTHFTTSSQEGSILPSLTVDVVTNLEETLKVCSLEGNTM